MDKLYQAYRSSSGAGQLAAYDKSHNPFLVGESCRPRAQRIIESLCDARMSYASQLKSKPDLALDQYIGVLEFTVDQYPPEDRNVMFKNSYRALKSAEDILIKMGKDPKAKDAWLELSKEYLMKFDYDEAKTAYDLAYAVDLYNSRNAGDDFDRHYKLWINRARDSSRFNRRKEQLENYFSLQPYQMRMFHKIEEHWNPPKEYESVDVTFDFTLDAAGNVSNVDMHRGFELKRRPPNIAKEESVASYNARLEKQENDLRQAITAAVKSAAPFEAFNMTFTYRLAEKNPPFGFNTLQRSPKPAALPLRKKESLADYTARLKNRIYDQWGITADFVVVRIEFTLHADGKIAEEHVVESSKSKVIDTGALQTIKMCEPFEPLPLGCADPTVFEIAFHSKVNLKDFHVHSN